MTSEPLAPPSPADTARAPAPVLQVSGLSVSYGGARAGLWGRLRRSGPGARPEIRVIEDISLSIAPGETLGLVGESGSGKTTLGRAILRRLPIREGRISLLGQDITHLQGEKLRRLRARMQIVLQDPYTSLNPRMTLAEILAEPLLVHGRLANLAAAGPAVAALLAQVGLDPAMAGRHPHGLSGGQRQRIGIARALALEPALIVADEPVSALDVSVRAQVVNLMQDLQRARGLSYLFIAHDLAVVRHIAHRVAILYAGRLVEIAPTESLYTRPRHPYTAMLLRAVPQPDPLRERGRILGAPAGESVDIADPPPGCRFHPRCPRASETCRNAAPPLLRLPEDDGKSPAHQAHRLACWHPLP